MNPDGEPGSGDLGAFDPQTWHCFILSPCARKARGDTLSHPGGFRVVWRLKPSPEFFVKSEHNRGSMDNKPLIVHATGAEADFVAWGAVAWRILNCLDPEDGQRDAVWEQAEKLIDELPARLEGCGLTDVYVTVRTVGYLEVLAKCDLAGGYDDEIQDKISAADLAIAHDPAFNLLRVNFDIWPGDSLERIQRFAIKVPNPGPRYYP